MLCRIARTPRAAGPVFLALWLLLAGGCASTANRATSGRQFGFQRDTFAYANELLWDYAVDPATGEVETTRREPAPEFHHRCFVMARAARQFFDFATFAPDQPRLAEPELRDRLETVLRRDPRHDPETRASVLIPGYTGLRELSADREALLKELCGGSWESYVQRGHWRIVLPFSETHQEKTAARLRAELARGVVPAIHLVRFPQLTINHAMLVIGVEQDGGDVRFHCYDPNDPEAPRALIFRAADRRFQLPPNNYFAGGRVDVYEVYRNWLY